MDKASLAEYLLTPILGKGRTGEVVGDLLETSSSVRAFWFSLARVALAYSWRWLLAVPAAMFSIALAVTPYFHLVVEPYVRQVDKDVKPMNFGIQPLPSTMQVGGYIVVVAMCVWTVAALAVIRYGHRSGVARVSGLFALLFTAGACLLELPHARIAVPAVLAAALVLALAYTPWRRLILCMAAVGTTFFLGLSVLGATTAFFVTHFKSFPLVALVPLGGYIASVIAEAWVLSQTRRWLRVS